MKVLYFTATGNSLYVAKAIGGELLSIPQLIKQNIYKIEDDVVGIIAPTYCADLPKMVKRYIKKLKIKANYIFGIMTFGYRIGDGLKLLEKYAIESGFKFDYINKIRLVDTALPRFEVNKQLKNLPKREVEKHLALIVTDIKEKKVFKARTSINDVLIGKVYHAFGKAEIADDKAQHYKVDDTCIKCGTCIKVCPSNNIQLVDNKITFLNQCEGCYGCIHNCPKKTLHPHKEKSTARYRHKDIKLLEIVNSNN